MEKNRNKDQKDPVKKEGQPGTQNKKHEIPNQPKSSGTDKQPSGRSVEQSQPREQPSGGAGQSQAEGTSGNEAHGQSGELKRPITNQDQQRQTTNAGSNEPAMGEEETEGDRRQHERIEPYKNMGDDSKDIEKKKPTME